MTIDFWGLGLQAVNVLILVWLLSRIFWRPVAAAIAKRQDSAKAVIDSAQAAQAKADAVLEEVTKARAGIAQERAALLDAAKAEAEAATKTALAEAQKKVGEMLAAAKTAIEKDAQAAREANADQAAELALTIAAHLLERLNGPTVQQAFLGQLVAAIAEMPATDRATLCDTPAGLELMTATDQGIQQDAIITAVQTALGGTPDLRFVTDPTLIAGLELRGPHFVIHNSWQADLLQVQKAVKDA